MGGEHSRITRNELLISAGEPRNCVVKRRLMKQGLLKNYHVSSSSIYPLFTISGSSFARRSPLLSKSLFFGFTFFINIVMLNLLIAIMGDKYGEIKETADAEFMYARASIVLEFENMMSARSKQNKEWFPTWLQVLDHAGGGDEERDLASQVRELKKALERAEVSRKNIDETNRVHSNRIALILNKVAEKLEVSSGVSPRKRQEMNKDSNI